MEWGHPLLDISLLAPFSGARAEVLEVPGAASLGNLFGTRIFINVHFNFVDKIQLFSFVLCLAASTGEMRDMVPSFKGVQGGEEHPLKKPKGETSEQQKPKRGYDILNPKKC